MQKINQQNQQDRQQNRNQKQKVMMMTKKVMVMISEMTIMATKSSNIIATDLDFDTIASNIKTYLKGQEKFKDYNF